MLVIKLIILAWILVYLEATSSSCGIRPFFSGQKIINGIESLPGDWAWNVAINDYGHFICGGILINNEWILTAAHCFIHTDDVSTLSIDIGVHNRVYKESWVKSVKASKLIVHEKFESISYINDIALLKLSEPINLDNKYYIPVCLPSIINEDNDPQNKTAWVTGWGSTYYGGSATIEKRQVSMVVLSDSKCKQYYSQVYNIPSQICAGEPNGNSGACYGDSGGPFVRQMQDGRWYVIGIVSWGYNCGKGTVFTRVEYFLPWINDKMNK